MVERIDVHAGGRDRAAGVRGRGKALQRAGVCQLVRVLHRQGVRERLPRLAGDRVDDVRAHSSRREITVVGGHPADPRFVASGGRMQNARLIATRARQGDPPRRPINRLGIGFRSRAPEAGIDHHRTADRIDCLNQLHLVDGKGGLQIDRSIRDQPAVLREHTCHEPGWCAVVGEIPEDDPRHVVAMIVRPQTAHAATSLRGS